MSYGELAAYRIAARQIAVRDRINTYQGVMLTKCDPEKHESIIAGWQAAINPEHTNTPQTHGSTNTGYTINEYMQLLGGGK